MREVIRDREVSYIGRPNRNLSEVQRTEMELNLQGIRETGEQWEERNGGEFDTERDLGGVLSLPPPFLPKEGL